MKISLQPLTTPESSIRQQELLYKDAMDRLYIESHPQYIYSDTVENIYALPEFKEYHDKLNVNDYIYMGLNDENYVKLRVIEIDYNPCDLDEQMTITFSNMIKYQTSTNDYDSLLDSVINSGSYDGGKVEGVSKMRILLMLSAQILFSKCFLIHYLFQNFKYCIKRWIWSVS